MNKLLSSLLLAAITSQGLAEGYYEAPTLRQGGPYIRAAANYNWIRSHDVRYTQVGTTTNIYTFTGVKTKTSKPGGEGAVGWVFPLRVYYLGVEAEYQYLGSPNFSANPFILNAPFLNSINNKTTMQTAGINLRLINDFDDNNRAFLEAGLGAAFFRSSTTMAIADPPAVPSVTQTSRSTKPYGSIGLGLGHAYTQNVEFDIDAVLQYLGNYDLGTFYQSTTNFGPLTLQARNVYILTASLGVTFSA